MNLVVLLASAILLQPVLDDATEVRLAASATGGANVDWYVDGNMVATTPSGTATTVLLGAGVHDVWATTRFDGTWRAVVRPTTQFGPGAVAYVDGWSGAHNPPSKATTVPWPLLLVVGGGVLVVAGCRRPKRP